MELRPPDPVNLAHPVTKPSYAEMAKGGVGIQPNFSPRAYNKSFQSVLMGEKTPIVKDTRSSEKFQNAPAAIFYDDEVDALAAPLQRTLVVWISFPNLRYHLYEGSALLNLAKSLGPPIQMDEATAKGTRPSKARVCIEFDCLVEPPTEIWVQVDLIQPQDKGKSIETDNYPILVDDAKTRDREIDREAPSGSLSEIKTPVNLTASDNLKEANLSSKISTDSKVGDSQPIGLCGLNTNDTIPSNCNTLDSTKSLNSDGRSLEFENHPRILTRRNSEGDVKSHFSTKDLGKRNLHAEFNETAIAKVIDAIPLNICLND
ncbi:GLYCINE-RICH CELL WALL STRUCTURAL PROTEIN 1.8-LIKE [Salix koriyanagi]|uniref:GLYCINE-RICH CELL WALL STRUCTURAL PROTEIN 1.8-LIKE n=1 Tax=Salix koriyanagi TaxID=2511006 RepID=A0A9Q0WBC4_9ROSI|nr:GLYCINE-RICH CELL WALL STRUCTURAL PROTEIN 1.8-LIKE [Salix koriyanagi]